MIPWYASLSVRQREIIEEHRDEAWEMLDPPSCYEKSVPHITIHPGFSCGHKTAASVAGLLAYSVGEHASVTGLSAWPGPDNPVVVKLDLDANLSSYRESIESHVEDAGGTIDREPVPPHITLFKSADADEEPDRVIRETERVRRALGRYSGTGIEVSGYRLKRRG